MFHLLIAVLGVLVDVEALCNELLIVLFRCCCGELQLQQQQQQQHQQQQQTTTVRKDNIEARIIEWLTSSKSAGISKPLRHLFHGHSRFIGKPYAHKYKSPRPQVRGGYVLV